MKFGAAAPNFFFAFRALVFVCFFVFFLAVFPGFAFRALVFFLLFILAVFLDIAFRTLVLFVLFFFFAAARFLTAFLRAGTFLAATFFRLAAFFLVTFRFFLAAISPAPVMFGVTRDSEPCAYHESMTRSSRADGELA